MVREGIPYLVGDRICEANLREAQVEEYATRVAQAAGLGLAQAPQTVVKLFGGRVSYLNDDEWTDEAGSIYVHGPQDFDILLPRFTSSSRDRFTVAHELGHYFLHSRQGKSPIIAHRRGSGRLEWEANWFAAELLMPRLEFRKAISEGLDEWDLAERFGVSVQAAEVRRQRIDS
jgi:hypothetical protein